jgi:hypothetical protein
MPKVKVERLVCVSHRVAAGVEYFSQPGHALVSKRKKKGNQKVGPTGRRSQTVVSKPVVLVQTLRVGEFGLGEGCGCTRAMLVLEVE